MYNLEVLPYWKIHTNHKENNLTFFLEIMFMNALYIYC